MIQKIFNNMKVFAIFFSELTQGKQNLLKVTVFLFLPFLLISIITSIIYLREFASLLITNLLFFISLTLLLYTLSSYYKTRGNLIIKVSMILVTLFFGLVSILIANKKLDSKTKEEAEKFFKETEIMGNNFDPSLFSLYSDDAKIISIRTNKETGESSKVELLAKNLKPIANKLMDMAKQNNDTTRYSNVKYHRLSNNKIKIKANRYSSYKCYNDTDFYAIIDKENKENSPYKIIEIFSKTYIQSNCKDTAKDVATILRKRIESTKKLLPLMIDDMTRLDYIDIEGKSLNQTITILLDIKEINQEFKEGYTEISCGGEDTKYFLNNGIEIKILFKNKFGDDLDFVKFSKKDCDAKILKNK